MSVSSTNNSKKLFSFCLVIFANVKKLPVNSVGFLLSRNHGNSPAKDVEKEDEKKGRLLPTAYNETKLGPVKSGEEIADAGSDAEHPAVEAEPGLLGHLRLAGHDFMIIYC